MVYKATNKQFFRSEQLAVVLFSGVIQTSKRCRKGSTKPPTNKHNTTKSDKRSWIINPKYTLEWVFMRYIPLDPLFNVAAPTSGPTHVFHQEATQLQGSANTTRRARHDNAYRDEIPLRSKSPPELVFQGSTCDVQAMVFFGRSTYLTVDLDPRSFLFTVFTTGAFCGNFSFVALKAKISWEHKRSRNKRNLS